MGIYTEELNVVIPQQLTNSAFYVPKNPLGGCVYYFL